MEQKYWKIVWGIHHDLLARNYDKLKQNIWNKKDCLYQTSIMQVGIYEKGGENYESQVFFRPPPIVGACMYLSTCATTCVASGMLGS